MVKDSFGNIIAAIETDQIEAIFEFFRFYIFLEFSSGVISEVLGRKEL